MSQRHILLIDDEDDIREVATISLQAIGDWRVSSATGGSEGIAMARAERPNVVLLDVMMPEIDGPATLRPAPARLVIGVDLHGHDRIVLKVEEPAGWIAAAVGGHH